MSFFLLLKNYKCIKNKEKKKLFENSKITSHFLKNVLDTFIISSNKNILYKKRMCTNEVFLLLKTNKVYNVFISFGKTNSSISLRFFFVCVCV
jgi:hypothetical protein